MKRRAEKAPSKQAESEQLPLERLRQLLLPMVAGISATKQHQGWVHDVGLEALRAVLEESATSVAGPKGHRLAADRSANRWGSTKGELPFGGRRIVIDRPRVMAKKDAAGRRSELPLPAWEHLRAIDPLPERVVSQTLLGVSTRGYEASLEPGPKQIRTRGTSKSSASRQLIQKTRVTMTSSSAGVWKRCD